MRTVTATGQTVDEAVQSALQQLNITEDQAVVDVIDEGKRGIFGLFGSKLAIVKVTQEDDPIEKAKVYLKNMIDQFDINVHIDTSVEGNVITFSVSGEDIAVLIGKRGQTLNAMQYLTQLALQSYAHTHYTVMLDAEGYRHRRKETLIQLAHRLADRSIQSNRKVMLDPMPSFERKIIHTALQDESHVMTNSDGVEPNRYVVIQPKS
ncbi:SpoIIIJ-associated protein [Gracilibacillus halophilus YIM-C55.5]|uniref:RNA-binding protein KhpB n=1 Tax=Gracilibacillus halophilus YIM-C55.5 TaxID=1308866 RepID=N4WQP5_9BACI|nr:RNA-binding cell elongation regulator Jag/EloR [Gracilibacillus halophilus]ENH98447.1 SpoIIIJ-associated protein [Gracilibacillus halophilus YIM-C55.5]